MFYLPSQHKIKIINRSQTLMGTVVEITATGKDEGKINRSITRALERMKQVEILMSKFTPESEISLINKNAGLKWVKVSPEVKEVLYKAKEFSRITGGAFDISIGILGKLWKFHKDSQVPLREEIGRLMNLVDYRKLRVDKENSKVFLAARSMKIDLGGIAKGFIVDRGVEELKKNGVENFIINAGGDLTARGSKNGRPWKVGIQDPRNRAKIFVTLTLNDKSITTSGDYEKYFLQEGKRFHHILDPRTGYPARDCLSTTIIANDATTADALATAVFVMGPDKGIKLIETLSGVEGIIVDKERRIILSSGLNGLIQ